VPWYHDSSAVLSMYFIKPPHFINYYFSCGTHDARMHRVPHSVLPDCPGFLTHTSVPLPHKGTVASVGFLLSFSPSPAKFCCEAESGSGAFSLAVHQVPTKAALSLHFSAGQGRKNMTKGLWVEIRTGRDHSPITITGKTDLTWGKLIEFITIQIRIG